MTPEQIEALARGMAAAAGGPPWWSYVLMLLMGAAGAYLGSYLQEKGKNLATKGDVKAITHTVEAAKREHQTILEDLKAGHQLRMVAAERRLETHQQAFLMWRRLFQSLHTPQVPEVANECLLWWEANCVFLGPESHAAFYDGAWAAIGHKGILDARSDPSEVKANWKKIMDVPNVLLREVALPPLKPKATEEKTATGPAPV